MDFDYFLSDMVERDIVRNGNNNMLLKCDELWVFEGVSDGVLTEIFIAKKNQIKIRYFTVEKNQISIAEKKDIHFEENIKNPAEILENILSGKTHD